MRWSGTWLSRGSYGVSPRCIKFAFERKSKKSNANWFFNQSESRIKDLFDFSDLRSNANFMQRGLNAVMTGFTWPLRRAYGNLPVSAAYDPVKATQTLSLSGSDPVTATRSPRPTTFRENRLTWLLRDGFTWRCDRSRSLTKLARRRQIKNKQTNKQ